MLKLWSCNSMILKKTKYSLLLSICCISNSFTQWQGFNTVLLSSYPSFTTYTLNVSNAQLTPVSKIIQDKIKSIFRQCSIVNLPVIEPISTHLWSVYPDAKYIPGALVDNTYYVNESLFTALSEQEQYAVVSYAIYHQQAYNNRDVKKLSTCVGFFIAHAIASVYLTRALFRCPDQMHYGFMSLVLGIPAWCVGSKLMRYMEKHDQCMVDDYIVNKAGSRLGFIQFLKRIRSLQEGDNTILVDNLTQRINVLEKKS